MKVAIENYRGFEIEFDTEKEVFSAYSNQYDRQETKKSYSAALKHVDDFLKENQNFKPVWIEATPNNYSSNRKIKLIGIRKDGRFIYEGKNGEKEQLSEYNEKGYILLDEANAPHWAEIASIQIEVDKLHAKLKEARSKVTGISLVDYKKTLTP